MSRLRCPLSLDEGCNIVNSIEVLDTGLVSRHFDAEFFFNKADQSQQPHRIEDSARAQRSVVTQARYFSVRQKLRKELPDLLFDFVHVCFLPYRVFLGSRSSQQSCREFRVLLNSLIKAFEDNLVATLVGMNVYSVFDLEVAHIPGRESLSKIDDRDTDAINGRANIVECLGL